MESREQRENGNAQMHAICHVQAATVPRAMPECFVSSVQHILLPTHDTSHSAPALQYEI